MTPAYQAGELHRTGREEAEATAAAAEGCAGGPARRGQGCGLRAAAGCSTLGSPADPAAAQGSQAAARCHPRKQLHCRDNSCGASSPQARQPHVQVAGVHGPVPTQALPSTLVRVRTGLLQALSGATRAECFFMVSRPPAGAAIAYILGPAERPSVPAASSVQEREARRPGPAPAAGPAPVAALTAAAAPRSTSSWPAATPHARAQPPAWRLLRTPTSRPSALPTPTRAHLLRPRPGRQARRQLLLRSWVQSACSLPAGPPLPDLLNLIRAENRRGPQNLASVLHKFGKGGVRLWMESRLLPSQCWFTQEESEKSQVPQTCINFFERT